MYGYNALAVPKNVVIYARVSTEHEAQLSALKNQLDWYKPLLEQHPEWTFVRMLLRMHIQPQGMAHHIKGYAVRVYVLLTDTQRNYQDKAEKGTAHGRYLHLADDTGVEVTVHGEEPVP